MNTLKQSAIEILKKTKKPLRVNPPAEAEDRLKEDLDNIYYTRNLRKIPKRT